MADKRARLKEKKRARQKKNREKARKARAARKPSGSDDGLRDANRWPVSECYLSDNWYDQGARVHAVFSRAREVGPAAFAQFEIDLAERGVVSVRTGVVPSLDHVRGLCVDLADKHAMLDTSPAQVVKVVRAAAEHGRSGGHGTPKGYEEAVRLFAGVDPDLAPHDVLVGEPEAKPEKKPSLFARLFGGG